MRKSRISSFFVLVVLLCAVFPVCLNAQKQEPPTAKEQNNVSVLLEPYTVQQSLMAVSANSKSSAYQGYDNGGIKEDVPKKYRERYERWKNDFLSTSFGRSQWDLYAQNPNFTLTITISDKSCNGGGTNKFKWDETGKLIAATITLGCRIDEGYPSPVYYPVMNSLSVRNMMYFVDGNTLAATKIAHEFGHVKHASVVNGELYARQNQLMDDYYKILLSNRHNTNDPRLIELTQQMGGTPIAIWEDREYWGETNAMLFLRDRIKNENERKVLFNRIIQTVELFAKDYLDRFNQIAQN